LRFNVLDIMRFAAALSVVFYHYTAGDSSEHYGFVSEFTKFGYLGVPLFFMISGFVISASALNRTPAEFAISRTTRLYPTVFACLTFTTLVILMFAPGETGISLFQYLSNLTILNVYAGQKYIDGVYWTLLAELKFYICIFLLLCVGLFDKFRIWLSVWMLATITYLIFEQPFFMGWFISPEYSAFFIAGVTFFLATKNGYNKFYSTLLIAAFIVGSIRAYQQATGFMHDTDTLDQIISLVVIWSFFLLFFMISLDKVRIKGNKVLLLLGGMTYPLYLLHSRAGHIFFDRLEGIMHPYISLMLITSMMLLLAFLVHVIVEKRLANAIKNYLFGKLHEVRGNVAKASEY